MNKLLYGYLQAVCKKEEDWSSHLPAIELGHNNSSIAGSRYFSPYFCLTGHNLIPVDPKILKSKLSGNTEVDEFVRKLLPKLDHVRKLTKLNIEDFKVKFKKRYDERFRVKPTQLKVRDYVYIEQKRFKIRDSTHLTPNFVGPFIYNKRKSGKSVVQGQAL